MDVILTLDQRFLVPLSNEYGSFLIVKEMHFCGDKLSHNIPQIHYTGTKVLIDLETEDVIKEENYTLVVDEEYNAEFGKDD